MYACIVCVFVGRSIYQIKRGREQRGKREKKWGWGEG